MTMLKFLVDGGSGVAYVLAEEIAAVIPARPESPDGSQIVLRTGQGLTVLNDCGEVAADWAAAIAPVRQAEPGASPLPPNVVDGLPQAENYSDVLRRAGRELIDEPRRSGDAR